jgi:hypothetical protein
MRSRKAVIAIVVALVVLFAAGIVVAKVAEWGPFADDATVSEPTAEPSASPSVSPAVTTPSPTASTTADPEPTDVPSDPIPDDPATTAGPVPTGGTATVVVTYANWEPQTSAVEVGAYAAVVEDAGTCTLTLTQGATQKTETISALVDVSTMSCGGFAISGSQLSSGTWTAVVSYSSTLSSGQSSPVEVVVP